MKKLSFVIIATSLLLSCSKGHEPTPNEEEEFCSGEIDLSEGQFPQTWKLVKMTGGMINSETTGVDMAWQEVIVLNSGGAFTKTRKRDNVMTEASGTYKFERSLGGDPAYIGLILTYSFENELIGSCQSILRQETYMLKSKCKLVGTWSACDGPGLEYTRQVFF